MSQYSPPPYQPPQPVYATPPGYPYNGGSGNGPARRAGILMFVLGGLAILGGLCCGLSGTMIDQMLAQQPEIAQQLPPEATPQVMRIGLLVVAGIGLLYGIGLVVLGLFVRKGAKPAVITAIILTGLTLLYLAAVLARAVVVGARQGAEGLGGGICVTVVPAALYVLLLVWLIQALRGGSAAPGTGQYPPEYLAYLQQQYAQQQAYQAWQQQQQQQGGQVPPVPPQAPPPQPPPGEGSTGGPTGSA